MSSMEEKKIIGSGNVNTPAPNETVKSGKRSSSILDSNDMNIKKIKIEFCREPSEFNNRNYTVHGLNSETTIDQNTINSIPIININTDDIKANNSKAGTSDDNCNDFGKKVQFINTDLFNIDKALMANEDNLSIMSDLSSPQLNDPSSCHSSKKEISINYELLSSNVEPAEFCRHITNDDSHKISSQKSVGPEIIKVNTSRMPHSDAKYTSLEEYTNITDVNKHTLGRDSESGQSCSTSNKETLESSLDSETKLKTKQSTCTISTSPQKCVENVSRSSSISSNTQTNNMVYQSRINPTSIMTSSNINNGKKNEPVIVTTKTLMSEITQTTAKVSIGNTTISVPLLKPVSSNQIMHGSTDLQKNHMKHSSPNQISSQLASQKNSKPPTILNIKRGQKINPPTIVSISQLQIKPSNNAKVVQATVLSKKLQMPNKSDSNTNPAINITPIRAKTNFIQSISYPKQPQISIHDISLSTKATEEQKATSSANNQKEIVTTENVQDKLSEYNTVQLEYPSIIINKQNINNFNLRNSTLTMTTKSTSTINIRGNDSLTTSGLQRKLQTYERAENPNSTTTMKKLVDSSATKVIPPLLTPLSKDTELGSGTTLKKIKCPPNNNSKTKDNTVPHLVTTGTTVLSTSTDPISSQRVTSTIGISCSPKVSTPVFTVPRTISLMLSKNNVHQSASTIVNTNLETSGDVTHKNVADNSSKKVPFPKMISLKKTSVSSQEDAVHHSNNVIPVSTTLTHVYQSSGNYDHSNIPNKADISTSKTGQSRSESTETSKDWEYNNKFTLSKHTLAEDQTKKNITTTDDKKNTTQDSTLTFSQPVEDGTLVSKSPTNKSPPRTEDSQNILLKQLLKNTSPNANHGLSTTAVSSICSQVLSTRKIVNVRAPSLGLVSSLEAQLARPVIPPVPAPNGSISHSNCATVEPARKKSVEANEQSPFEAESKDTATTLDNKYRQPIQTISKETSFVSNPKVPSKSHNTNRNTLMSNSSAIENIINTNPNPNVGVSITATSNKTSNQNSEGSSTTVAITQITEQKTRSSELEIKNAQFNTNRSNKEMFTVSSNTIPVNESDVQIRYQAMGSTLIKSSIEKTKSRLNIKPSSDHSDMSISQSQDNTSVQSNTPETKTSILSSPQFSENMSATTPMNNQIPSASKKKDEKGPPFSNARYVQNPSTTVTPYLHVERIPENNEVIKETEQRKKRKRDLHKHKRQLIKCKRDSSTLNESTNSKKRLRKCSKIEEDYDMYIDNLLIQMKQMTPLQVLEPFLCKNFGICPMHGSRYMTDISGNKEFGECLLNQYIRGQHDKRPTADFYDVKPFGNLEKSHDNSISMQNDFYDQEFLSHLHEHENQKFSKLINTIKEMDVDNSENIFVSNVGNYDTGCRVQINKLSQTNFPGLVIINNPDEYLGRISPVIPFVEPVPFKYKSISIITPQIFDHPKSSINSKMYKDSLSNESQIRNHTLANQDEQRSVTVILTLSSADALNVMGVLKDLSNILKINPVSTYEVMDEVSNSSPYAKSIHRTRKNPVFDNFMEIQDVLNHKKKLCRNCGCVVNKNEIRVPYKSLRDLRKKINFSPDYIYFCSKACCTNFKAGLKSNAEECPSESNSDCEKHLIKSTGDYSNLSKKCRFKYFNTNCFQSEQIKTNSQNDTSDIFLKYNITLSANDSCNAEKGNANKELTDTRYCILCNQKGDGVSDGPSRLLNFDVDKWVHLNCALWSNGVYETISGGLMNVEIALQTGVNQVCSSCHLPGATIKCFKSRCSNTYHLLCAKKEQCIFYKNKTIHCQGHALKSGKENELSSLSVHRRVFVERDESRQVATIMHHSDQNNLLRVGSLIFLNVGQLLPHQLDAFHTTNYIYPVGYKAVRFYWSMDKPSKRCRYTCSVADVAGRPEFRVQVQDNSESGLELRDSTPNAVWKRILEPIVALRKKCKLVQIFPEFISGDELFGFNEPSIVRILESLPGVETLTDYRFKYGRNPLLELPLAIHPSGAARTEPKQRQVLGSKKHHTQRTASTTNQRLSNSMVVGEVACPYSKQFVHSKSSQYKKMKQEWRNNVYLARSKIQGLGLYAARDLEKHTMIIEYIGEVIRTEVSEIREKQYEARNRGIYMFRLDEDRVVDATLSGGLARYINHSCNPNCVTEIVDVDRELRIIIFAKRRINRGEELSYDYKFDIEDDAHKLSCMCGSSNCKKWMN